MNHWATSEPKKDLPWSNLCFLQFVLNQWLEAYFVVAYGFWSEDTAALPLIHPRSRFWYLLVVVFRPNHVHLHGQNLNEIQTVADSVFYLHDGFDKGLIGFIQFWVLLRGKVKGNLKVSFISVEINHWYPKLLLSSLFLFYPSKTSGSCSLSVLQHRHWVLY